jgi:hypothetical protein
MLTIFNENKMTSVTVRITEGRLLRARHRKRCPISCPAVKLMTHCMQIVEKNKRQNNTLLNSILTKHWTVRM